MKVPGLEIGLAPAQGGLDAPEVAEGAQVIGPVEKLGHTYLAAAPIPGGNGIVELVRYDPCPYGRTDDVPSSLLAGPLELILHVPHQIPEGSPEEVGEHLPREFDYLVSVVVLVVGAYPPEPKLEELADSFAH